MNTIGIYPNVVSAEVRKRFVRHSRFKPDVIKRCYGIFIQIKRQAHASCSRKCAKALAGSPEGLSVFIVAASRVAPMQWSGFLHRQNVKTPGDCQFACINVADRLSASI